MATNYSPTIVTDGAVFVGDALMPSISEPGTRVYNRAGVDSADVKLLVHGNVGSGQNFSDSSLSNHTITAVGNTTHSTAQSKFSGGSIYFDGVGDYLSVPDSSDWAFGTDDFTIDFWFNPTGFASYTGLIVQNPTTFGSTDSDHGLFIEVDNASTKLRLFIRPLTDPYSGDMFTEISQTGIVAGTWYHVAVVRETGADKITMYLNGSSVGSSTWSGSTSYPDFATPLLIGVRNDQSDYFSGYMDEVRITKGAALWTQDFTPPARRDTLSISDGMMYNGSCVDFDGTDDYIDLGSIAFGTKDISVAVWFTLDAFDDDYACIFNNRTSSAGNAGFEIRQRTSGTKIQLQFDWGAGSNSVDTGALATGTWHHIVATLDRSGYLRGYLNGVEFGSPLDISSHSATSITNDNSAFIGADGYLSNFWNGQAADLKIYENTVLSASQVTEIYNNSKVIIPSNVSQTNLMGWWPLVDGAGTIAYDGSGNGNDGTLTNMTSADWLTGQTGAPQLIQGYNRPMLLDGSTDYVSIADSASLSVGSTFTISYWFYPESVTTEAYHVSKNTYSGNQKSYAVLQAYSGKTQFRISGDGSSHIECTGSTTMSNKTWHHIVHVFDGSAGTKLKGWVDGTAQTFTQQPNVTGPYDSTSILCLGTRDAGLVAPLKGTINEVIIYNSALSDANATALFATGPNGGPLPPDPLSMSTSGNIVGYWRNDNNVTLTDLSGNSNTGTAVGSPSALLFKQGINGSANTSTGRDGQGFPLKYKDVGAVGYKGSNYISVPHSSVFDNTAFSFCSWVYVPGDTTTDGKVAHLSRNSSGNGWAVWQLRTVNGVTNEVKYQTNNGGTWQTQTYSNFFSGAGWYYVCVTHIQGNAAKLYRNSIEVSGSGSCTQDFEFGIDPLYIGARKNASTMIEFWDGQIANSQYYNRALSYAEIQQNYNAQKGRFT